jgi:hypothetical protein
MPFNTEMNANEAPFNNEMLTLTNDECVEVKDKCQTIKDEFVPSDIVLAPDLQYVVSTYNKQDWTKAINGITYEVLERYNPDVNTQGISPDAPDNIVPEPEETPEEPTETPEEPTEEPTEGETSPDEENPPNEPETAPADAEETTEEA